MEGERKTAAAGRPRGARRKELDADGVPVDARDWTEADWGTLWHAMTAAKRVIASRHRPTDGPTTT